MPDLNVLLAAFGYAVLTGLLNLIFSRKTQIEAWCAANPRLAAVGMFMRSIGFDPHNLWAFVTLLVAKKLPAIKIADSDVVKAEVRKLDAKATADDTVRIVPPGSLLVLLFGLGIAVHQQGCSAPIPITPDVCSKVSLATIVAGCDARAKECEPGDTTCPLYLECKRAINEWRNCP